MLGRRILIINIDLHQFVGSYLILIKLQVEHILIF